MLPTETSILQSIASSIINPVTYGVLVLTIGILLRLLMIPFYTIPDSYKTVIALIIPIALLEPILSILFGLFGITLNWGNYVYSFPFYGNIDTSSFIMLSRFLNMIFGFGVFTTFGLPYLTEYIKTVTVALPEPDTIVKIVVFGYVSLDSVIEYLFCYVFFYTIIVILSDTIGSSTKNSKIYALLLAIIPVVLYNIFISNSFSEYSTSIPIIQQVFFFIDHAPLWSKIMFFGSFLISFLLVMEILAVAIDVLHRFGATTIKPGWETKRYAENPTGVAFVYTVAYGVMFVLKGISWYVFFILLILYSIFKSFSGDMINNVKERDSTKDMQKGIVDMIEKKGVDDENGMNWGAVLIISGIGGVVAWLWWIGLLKL